MDNGPTNICFYSIPSGKRLHSCGKITMFFKEHQRTQRTSWRFFDQRTEVSPLMAGKKTVIALSSYGHGMK